MKIKSFFLTIMCICCLSQTSSAIFPKWYSNFLFFQYEYGDYSRYTLPHAIINGLETWYNKYAGYINILVLYGPYTDYLPPWGWITVTPEYLASEIYVDAELGLNDVPYSAFSDIISWLQVDIDVGWQGPPAGEMYDPYDWLLWRSKYMENRRKENNSSTKIMANCWGTADYLAMDYEWAQGYPSNKQWALNNGYGSFGATFPHIYVDGGRYYRNGQYNPYCIDDDLSGANSNVEYKLCGAGRTVSPNNVLNSFDVIRLSYTPQTPPKSYEMLTSTSENVGENRHCVAYLCTDQMGQSWIYEKHNFGNARQNPYGINILGYDQWTSPVLGIGNYNFSYNSYFKKYGYSKNNLANTLNENWAGINP